MIVLTLLVLFFRFVPPTWSCVSLPRPTTSSGWKLLAFIHSFIHSFYLSICFFTYICLFICFFIYICLFICFFTYICLFICFFIYICLFICFFTYICLFLCFFTYIFLFFCFCTYICLFICFFIYICLFICFFIYIFLFICFFIYICLFMCLLICRSFLSVHRLALCSSSCEDVAQNEKWRWRAALIEWCRARITPPPPSEFQATPCGFYTLCTVQVGQSQKPPRIKSITSQKPPRIKSTTNSITISISKCEPTVTRIQD